MLGVQCRLGEGRAVQVVLRVVVDWKREGEAEISKEMTMADQMTDSCKHTKMIQCDLSLHGLEPQAHM